MQVHGSAFACAIGAVLEAGRGWHALQVFGVHACSKCESMHGNKPPISRTSVSQIATNPNMAVSALTEREHSGVVRLARPRGGGGGFNVTNNVSAVSSCSLESAAHSLHGNGKSRGKQHKKGLQGY
jgi:hypothetical protein